MVAAHGGAARRRHDARPPRRGAGRAPDSDPVALARRSIHPWNAHDAGAVVALFLPDAAVRQPAPSSSSPTTGTVRPPRRWSRTFSGRAAPPGRGPGGPGAGRPGGEVLSAAGARASGPGRDRAVDRGAPGGGVGVPGGRGHRGLALPASPDPYQRLAVSRAEGLAALVVRRGRVARRWSSPGKGETRRPPGQAVRGRWPRAPRRAGRPGPGRSAARPRRRRPQPRRRPTRASPLGLAGVQAAAALAGLYGLGGRRARGPRSPAPTK